MKANYTAWHIPAVLFDELTPTEKLTHLLRYAVLAPSAHNTQPWRFRIAPQKHQIYVELEESRSLPFSDPDEREVYISLGAAIENICQAADAFGCTPKVQLLPSAEAVATITISYPAGPFQTQHEKLAAITHRRSNRSPFKNEPLKPKNVPLAQPDVHFVTDSGVRATIGKLVAEADITLMNSTFKNELAELVHHKWTGAHVGMPASVQDMPGPLTLLAKFFIRRAPIEKDQAKKDARLIARSPLLAVVCGKRDDKRSWLEAGRTLERLWLQATYQDLSVAALASVIEHNESRFSLQKLIKCDDYPLAFVRIGHATKPLPRTPRLTVQEVMKKG